MTVGMKGAHLASIVCIAMATRGVVIDITRAVSQCGFGARAVRVDGAHLAAGSLCCSVPTRAVVVDVTRAHVDAGSVRWAC